jgi:hypothetical protein
MKLTGISRITAKALTWSTKEHIWAQALATRHMFDSRARRLTIIFSFHGTQSRAHTIHGLSTGFVFRGSIARRVSRTTPMSHTFNGGKKNVRSYAPHSACATRSPAWGLRLWLLCARMPGDNCRRSALQRRRLLQQSFSQHRGLKRSAKNVQREKPNLQRGTSGSMWKGFTGALVPKAACPLFESQAWFVQVRVVGLTTEKPSDAGSFESCRAGDAEKARLTACSRLNRGTSCQTCPAFTEHPGAGARTIPDLPEVIRAGPRQSEPEKCFLGNTGSLSYPLACVPWHGPAFESERGRPVEATGDALIETRPQTTGRPVHFVALQIHARR